MEINSEQLEALLELLVRSGVEEFEGFGFHVRFTTALFTKDKEIPQEPMMVDIPEREEVTSAWKDPELWPGGKPPSFPSR